MIILHRFEKFNFISKNLIFYFRFKSLLIRRSCNQNLFLLADLLVFVTNFNYYCLKFNFKTIYYYFKFVFVDYH